MLLLCYLQSFITHHQIKNFIDVFGSSGLRRSSRTQFHFCSYDTRKMFEPLINLSNRRSGVSIIYQDSLQSPETISFLWSNLLSTNKILFYPFFGNHSTCTIQPNANRKEMTQFGWKWYELLQEKLSTYINLDMHQMFHISNFAQTS